MDYENSKVAGTASATLKSPQPAQNAPLLRLTERLHAIISEAENRLTDVILAIEKQADRLIGESPAVSTTKDIQPPEPITGHGGHIGEVEAVIARAEYILGSLTQRAGRAVSRLGEAG